MVTKTDKGTIEQAFGFDNKKQPPTESGIVLPFDFTFEYPIYASNEEAANAGYNFVALANTAAKTKAKAAAYQKAISPLKPDVNSPDEVRKRLVNDLMKVGKTQAEAEALVGSL